MRRKLFAFVLAAATCLVASSALAGPATDAVKTKQTQLFQLIAQPKTPARQTKLRELFDDMLAYDELARESLGKPWGDLNAAEQKQFSELLTQLVRNNYKRNLEKMLDYEIRYVDEKSGRGGTLVKSLAKHKTKAREPEVEIDFLLQSVGGKLKVVDIITERASLVKTYRSQFLRILRKDGFAKLIEKMKSKLAKQDPAA